MWYNVFGMRDMVAVECIEIALSKASAITFMPIFAVLLAALVYASYIAPQVWPSYIAVPSVHNTPTGYRSVGVRPAAIAPRGGPSPNQAHTNRANRNTIFSSLFVRLSSPFRQSNPIGANTMKVTGALLEAS